MTISPSMTFSTKAPGKMLLCGEYAVLEGYPALVAAVDRYATCHKLPSSTLSVSAQGIGPYDVVNSINGYTIPQDAARFFKVAAALFNAAHAHHLPLEPALYHLDTANLYSFSVGKRPLKMGLGSSAASAVCLAAHLANHHATELNRDAIFDLALTAHRAAAQGKGSGIDIAASCYGGLLEFQVSPDGKPTLRHRPPPKDHSQFLIVHTHTQQKTSHFVGAVQHVKAEYPHLYRAVVQQLANANAAFMAAFFETSIGPILNDAVAAINRALQDLGDLAHIGIVSAPHVCISQIAHAHGGSAKPSGAGGGDIAACFIPTDAQASFCQAITRAGFTPLYVSIAMEGIHYVTES